MTIKQRGKILVVKNKYNPNAQRKIITSDEMSRMFDKLYKASKWSKIKFFKHGLD